MAVRYFFVIGTIFYSYLTTALAFDKIEGTPISVIENDKFCRKAIPLILKNTEKRTEKTYQKLRSSLGSIPAQKEPMNIISCKNSAFYLSPLVYYKLGKDFIYIYNLSDKDAFETETSAKNKNHIYEPIISFLVDPRTNNPVGRRQGVNHYIPWDSTREAGICKKIQGEKVCRYFDAELSRFYFIF